ncbi:MAG: serine/threonine protein kinase [Deltaproteobacteria bacterium]|nr:serine/threonine protein kinase [Deltaproteobacteria bacterium]
MPILSEGSRRLAIVGWWLFVALALLSNFVAIPYRRDEMLTACQAPAKCAMGQLAAVEHAALEAAGIGSQAYFWGLEALATLVLTFCVGAAAVLYWGRRDSRIAFFTSIFLVLAGVGSTLNVPALQAAHPEFWLWFACLDAISAIVIVLVFYVLPTGDFAPGWTRKASIAWVILELLTIPLRKTAEGNQLMSVLLIVALITVVVAQVQRFRRVSSPVEQQQTKWLLLACGVQAASYSLAVLVTVLWLAKAEPSLARVATQTGLKLLIDVTLLLVVLAFFNAIRRHRLWDIDFYINRSLVYGGVTAALALTFAGSVVVLRDVAMRLTNDRQTPWVLALSTMVVGALFAPTRRQLCLLVDRKLYGIGIDVAAAERGERLGLRAAEAHGRNLATLGPAAIPMRPIAAALSPMFAMTEGELLSDGDTSTHNHSTLTAERRNQHQAPPRFENLEFIGAGGMARVYKSLHPDLGRPVAIKVLATDVARRSTTSVARFVREGDILATIEHRNVVRLFDRGITIEGVHYQVLEYVSGPDLACHLGDRGRLTLGEALPLLEQLAEALDHIHEHGIIHRDIKPGNVLLDPLPRGTDQSQFRAVLSDFGIARASAMERLTATDLIGTLVYVAPEQIQHAADVDGRADIYALGVMAYELLTGQPPFRGDYATSLIMAHLKQPPPDQQILAPTLPPTAARTLLWALAKKPSERPATAVEFVRQLRRASEQGAVPVAA